MAARNLAAFYAGKLVVILSASLSGGFSSYTATNDYVALGNAPPRWHR